MDWEKHLLISMVSSLMTQLTYVQRTNSLYIETTLALPILYIETTLALPIYIFVQSEVKKAQNIHKKLFRVKNKLQ